MDEDGVIGRDGKLPWHLPRDAQFFKNITSGHAVIMGRATFESIGKPLPNRKNVVVSRNREFCPEGVITANSLELALRLCESDEQIFIIGGASLCEYAMKKKIGDYFYCTTIHHKFEGDVALHAYDPDDWAAIEYLYYPPDEENKYGCSFALLERVRHDEFTKPEQMKPQITKSRNEGDYEYGCVFVDFNQETLNRKLDEIKKPIPAAHVYRPDDPRFGYEDEPHVTALYGLLELEAPDYTGGFGELLLRELYFELSPLPREGVWCSLQSLDFFECPDYDVLHIKVYSEQIKRLDGYLREKYEYHNPYPFNPHLTLAYLLPGSGRRFVQELTPVFQRFAHGHVCYSGIVSYTSPSNQKFNLHF